MGGQLGIHGLRMLGCGVYDFRLGLEVEKSRGLGKGSSPDTELRALGMTIVRGPRVGDL